MKNTKTTGFGIATIISILSGIAMQFFGGGEVNAGELGAAISGILGAIGLIFARDAETPETVVEKTETITAR